MKNKYIKHFTLLASLVFGATGVFAQETNSDCDIDSPKEEHLQYTRNVNNLESLDPDRFVQNLNPDYDLVWYTTDDPSKEPNSLGQEKMTFDRSKAGSYLFYIAYKDGDCYSERARVEVDVLAAPMPAVKNIDLCKNATFDPMDGIRSTDEPYFELIWFIDPTDTVGKALTTPPTDVVDVTTPGKYTYYVAQRMKTSPYAQSDVASFDVIVYGVMPPIDASTHEYCAHDAAEPLKAIKQENLLNYYGADDVWFKFGATEYEAVTPDTRVNSTMTYNYEAYQKFQIPMTGEVCIGPSIDIEVKVVAVGRPIFKGNVIYDKNEAIDTKEFQDILTKYPDAIEIVEGQTLLWSRDKDGTYIKGSSPSSKPTYDIMLTSQEVQERWVKWEVQTESGLVCQSEPSEINITIISSSVPIVKDVEICENDYLAGAINLEDFAKINDNNGMMSAIDYQLYWYTDKAKAEAAIKNGPSEGSTTAPALNTLVDISSDQMRSSWEGEVYVVQSNGISTSAASRIRITVNATPRLKAIANDPVCGEIDLTSDKYWVVENGNIVLVSYSFDGVPVSDAQHLTVAGDYAIDAVSPQGCKSDPLIVPIDIRNLSIEMDPMSMTCPGDNVNSEVKINYAYNKNSYAAQDGDVKLSWTSKESGSTKPIQSGIISYADATAFIYQSGKFEGDAGNIQKIEIEVTDGYCVANAWQKVVIGNGPVEGTFTWSEDNNQSGDNGKSTPIKDDIEIYACGDIVNIDFSNVAMDEGSLVEWFKTNDYSMSPAKVGTLVSFSKEDYGTYYVRYTNGCYAYVTVEIIDATVKINSMSQGDVLKCEGEDYVFAVDIESKAGAPTFEWHKDGINYTNNSHKISFSPLLKKDEGVYNIKCQFEGCFAEMEVVNLKIKEYVKVDVADADTYNAKKSYIVRAGDDANVEFKFTVPNDASEISKLHATLTDMASSNKGSLSSDNSAFAIIGVDEDHFVRVAFESKNYCQGEIDFQVLRDAKLNMNASVQDVLCLNETAVFAIDTVGTGRFLLPGANLRVTSTTESGVTSVEEDFIIDEYGILKKTISPLETTVYNISFEYGEQHLKATNIVNVLSNPIILSIDSIDVREREVILDSYLGTGTYQLRVDDGEWMDNTSLTNLSDGLHTLYVQDSNGCSTSETFIVNQTNDVANIFADRADEIINVYTITGALVKSNVKRSEALNGLANGIYMIGGDKVIVNK